MDDLLESTIFYADFFLIFLNSYRMKYVSLTEKADEVFNDHWCFFSGLIFWGIRYPYSVFLFRFPQ